MLIQQALQKLLDRRDLSADEMRSVMRQIMSGGATDAQIGGFLIALRCKGETVDEIAAAAEIMHALAVKVPVAELPVIDTCGTGGDGANTFNISTAAAFVVAAAGVPVAKHGNRSVSGCCGSADVLEAAGVNLDLTPAEVADCIRRTGIGFLFAPRHHGAMRYAIGPRREMGVRTLFNLLGPLVNPAGARHQVIGVFCQTRLETLARVLQKTGSRHVLIVAADDGLDEISIASPTRIAELNHGNIHSYTVTPEQFGFPRTGLATLAVATVRESLRLLQSALGNEPGPALDIVALNAGAALYAADHAASWQEGIDLARTTLASGAALDKLKALVAYSNRQP